MMLSPDAELRELVESVAEPRGLDEPDHLSYREARSLLIKTIQATLACMGLSIADSPRTVRLALLDLERGTSLTRSGI